MMFYLLNSKALNPWQASGMVEVWFNGSVVSDLQSGQYEVFTPATIPGTYSIALYVPVAGCDYRSYAAVAFTGATPSVPCPLTLAGVRASEGGERFVHTTRELTKVDKLCTARLDCSTSRCPLHVTLSAIPAHAPSDTYVTPRASRPERHLRHAPSDTCVTPRATLTSHPERHLRHAPSDTCVTPRATLTSHPERHLRHAPSDTCVTPRATLASRPERHLRHAPSDTYVTPRATRPERHLRHTLGLSQVVPGAASFRSELSRPLACAGKDGTFDDACLFRSLQNYSATLSAFDRFGNAIRVGGEADAFQVDDHPN
eukprot:1194282-Prorocentrum_minimum.AAC.4